MILVEFAVVLKNFISKQLLKRVIFKLGKKMAGVEDYEIDLESNAASSVFGDEKTKELKLKYRLTVSPHLKGRYKPKRIEADDTAEFFVKVMKIKPEDMSTINWSMRKITHFSFIITMHLTVPEVFDKANFQL